MKTLSIYSHIAGIKAVCGNRDQIPDLKCVSPEWDGDDKTFREASGNCVGEFWSIIQSCSSTIINSNDYVFDAIQVFYSDALHGNQYLPRENWQRYRIGRVIEELVTNSVANQVAKHRIHIECFKRKLMQDFKYGVTLPKKEAYVAADKLAGELVELLMRLGQEPIAGEVPIFS